MIDSDCILNETSSEIRKSCLKQKEDFVFMGRSIQLDKTLVNIKPRKL